ncbi:MAG: hypothetical protein KC983_00375, partial [Phycisphaerales bacterium]|nr:hypothetical protein [Phycisphaerales bacterium]
DGKQIFYALCPDTIDVMDNGVGLSIDTGTVKMAVHPIDADDQSTKTVAATASKTASNDAA